MSVKVLLIDIYNRLTQFDKKVGIIKNGEDNAYAERTERYINNSVTAKTSANIMAAYLAGRGFGDDNNKIIVNSKKQTTLLKFTRKLSKSVSRQRGAYIHVNYNMNYTFDSFDLLPYTHCRAGKKDDDRYNGKIGVSDKFTNEKLKDNEITFIDVYNPREDVIKAQVEVSKGKTDKEKWDNYKGQILFINFDEDYIYPLSTIDAVSNDCDSEAQASIFKNRSLRKGFFGKTLVLTDPLVGGLNDYDTPELYAIAKSEREDFKDTINDFIGAENVGGALHVEKEFNDQQKLEDVFKVVNIDSNIDDKIFEYTESSTFKNILMAFNNLPMGLIRSDNTLFAQSGESIQVMREVYQDNTSAERMEIEQIVQELMAKFKEPKEVNIVPLIDVKDKEVEPVKTKTDDTTNK